MEKYKYIVWVGGVDVHLCKTYKVARNYYDEWLDKGYDDVILEVLD